MIATANKQATATDRFLDRPVFSWWPSLTIERALIILILLLTVVSRFYDVGARTMAHDEVNHVEPAYRFPNYTYDPVTHGPFQFHALALSYALFGDSDFSARIPAVLFGIAVVAFALFAWRRYLGRVGALIAGTLFMISPFILFYSRYTRNEIFIVFWGLVMLWLFLRYLEEGETKFLLWLSLITALHYADKATSFIFSAEALIFLALLFLGEAMKASWKTDTQRKRFRLVVGITLILLVVTLGIYVSGHQVTNLDAPVGNVTKATSILESHRLPLFIGCGLSALSIAATLVLLVQGLGWLQIRKMRSFDLVVLQLLLILPLLTALVLKVLGMDPIDYSQLGIVRSAIVFIILLAISLFFGLLWNKKVFLLSMGIFWGIFVIFYTTLFVQGQGFFKGIVGALGYWMSQQAEGRANQPLFYYALVQIPLYEFLPALGTILAALIAFRRRLFFCQGDAPFSAPVEEEYSLEDAEELGDESNDEVAPHSAWPVNDGVVESTTLLEDSSVKTKADELASNILQTQNTPVHEKQKLFSAPPQNLERAKSLPTIALLLYWTIMSLMAFTIAGERMPWLTTHITMPMILCAGWGLGYLFEHIAWDELKKRKAWLVCPLMILLILALFTMLGSLLGNTPPFAGKELHQLQATSTFLMALVGLLGSGVALISLLKGWKFKTFFKMALVLFFGILAIQTGRDAFRSAYISYDNATEMLVYAHSTGDMKDSVEQIEMISKRLYGDKSIMVAHDNETRYPYWWYLRDYPNKYDFDKNVTKKLQDYPIIVAGAGNYSRLEAVVRDNYYRYDLKRMWWPHQQIYENLSFTKVFNDLKVPAKRAALWQIWLNGDYTQYGVAYNDPSVSLATWSPSDVARMYIRKDLAAQIWELGVSPAPIVPEIDPYAGGTVKLEPDKVISSAGNSIFNAPRGMAAAPDGSLYVADSRNNRIVHLDANGLFLNSYGTYANAAETPAPGGTMNEPWGVAVGSDGLVYVADTWNHRIQVFDAKGTFLRMWNSFEVSGVTDGFWGPRGIAVDSYNRVFVTDTGKQRVVVFDSQGRYLSQFGGLGLELGQLDEPVGIAVDKDGRVYVADTWNDRVQVFAPDAMGQSWLSEKVWELKTWKSNSLENKPYLTLDGNYVYFTDPEAGQIFQFDMQGKFLKVWGGYESDYLMGNLTGICVDKNGKLWVADGLNNALISFSPPQ